MADQITTQFKEGIQNQFKAILNEPGDNSTPLN